MLRSLEDLIGVSVMATDGEIGKVCNFLFDDQAWMIRYLVVELGSWLARREVVISVSAIGQPDWEAKTFHASLTREQVRRGPDIDSAKPVSRQQEIAMKEHFGWPAYWSSMLHPEIPAGSIPAGQEFPVPAGEDPHLRSRDDVVGYGVWADDGEIGRLESFIVDEASWHIGYIDVKTGDWLHCRSMLVPTLWVKSVSWAYRRVNLEHTWKPV